MPVLSDTRGEGKRTGFTHTEEAPVFLASSRIEDAIEGG